VKKIYIGNLPWSATDASLRDTFSSFGEVESASVVTDRETGRSRGFGFVEMDGPDADKAIRELDGRDLDGRAMRVNEARPKERRERASW
jgi:RNA recognition motif-containing protein